MRKKTVVNMDFLCDSENEHLARIVVGHFLSELVSCKQDLDDIKLAVTEAVSNAIAHAYDDEKGKIFLRIMIRGTSVIIQVRDEGKGIVDIEKALEPFSSSFTDSSGMGFTIMQSFMDRVIVYSKPEIGTTITMIKKL